MTVRLAALNQSLVTVARLMDTANDLDGVKAAFALHAEVASGLFRLVEAELLELRQKLEDVQETLRQVGPR
ncbi:hypothetical protein [Achromobacter ruhlandii]|uniref:hypothetical protein n=1 Tax=Achromobacter ruhlandii TaxID=72557 RepID=UPI000AAE2DE6|nr:hypothetical protein [Achromobacter ruhlandii]